MSAPVQPVVIPSSRYDTEEKRRNHAERQKKWRQANPDKVKSILKKSRQRELADPDRSERRKQRLKNYRKKKETLALRQTQKKRRYQKTQNATNSHRRWTDDEIAIAFSRDLTDVQIGEALGRSVQAVALARQRYAHRAPIGWTAKA